MKKIAWFIFFITIQLGAFAQLKEYPPAESDYLAEVLKQLVAPQENMRKEVEQMKLDLTTAWQSGYFTLNAKQEIIATSNIFLKKRYRTFPFFYNYLRTLIQFQKTSAKNTNYNIWAESLKERLANGKTTIERVDRFLSFTQAFLLERILFDNGSVQWKSISNDYTFSKDGTLKIKLTTGDLIGKLNTTPPDSIVIYRADGTLLPWEEEWIGSGGKVTWERAGWEKEEVYALLSSYKIVLKRIQFSAEDVEFTHKKYVKRPVTGKLTERLISGARGERAEYPQFESDQKRFELKGIFKNIDYSGGFSMRGSKFVGSGDRQAPAVIRISNKNRKFIESKALAFTIYKNRLGAINANVSINLGKDSISHPNLTFKYNDTTKVVSFIRKRMGAESVEFYNSFHQIRMDVERIQWKTGTDSILMRALPGAPRTRSTYTSVDYFNLREFEMLKGMDSKHPLLAMNKFATDKGFTRVPIDRFASYVRKPSYQIRQLFTRLAYDGFLDFKKGDEDAGLTPKFHQYLKARRRAILDQVKSHIYRYNRNKSTAETKFKEYIESNTKDYDIIKINTDTTSIHPSGILDLKSNALTINGVDSVPLSLKYKTIFRKYVDEYGDSIRVKEKHAIPITIRPVDRKIVMNADRDFFYNGELKVKDFAFTGRNFQFKYKDFKVNLDSIDYLRLSIYDEDEQDYKNVLHIIENIKGDVLLDSASNKSGTLEAYRYPIFNSLDTSLIYYNDIDIMEIAYPKKSFYLEIYPYTIESLFDFTADKWRQKGYFRSGGIVPDFEDIFIIRKDSTEKFGDPETHYSFGFQKEINPRGMPAYGGRGVLYQELNLSMKGLIGNGRLDYASSTMKSTDFIFTPDSMVAYTTNFKIQRDAPADVPNVYTEESDVVWRPYENTLDAQGIGHPFYMYDDVMRDDTVTFHGKMTVKPDSLFGNGELTFVDATMEAEDFIFQGDHYQSNSAKFTLNDSNSEEPIFETNNIKAEVKLADKSGSFQGNENSFVEFPSNEYICYADQFQWDFYDKQIDFTSSKEYTDAADSLNTDNALLMGSRFVSTQTDQDSLSFVSGSSNFDPVNKIITANDVRLIRVADATVYPSGPIVIKENAAMDPLYAATIIAPTLQRYHTLFNATAKIGGRNDYKGSGDYEYVDENDQIQTVHFDEISVNDDNETIGHGYVEMKDTFMLSQNFGFFGDMNLHSTDSLLTFDGFTELRHNSEEASPLTWIKFRTRIEPTDIKIPITKEAKSANQNEKGELVLRKKSDIFAGFMITRDSTHIYTDFLSRKKNPGDKPVLSALPQSREELKVTKIEDSDKKQKKKEDELVVTTDSTALLQAKLPKEKTDSITALKDSITTDPLLATTDTTLAVTTEQPVDSIAQAIDLEGDIFIPQNDTLAYLIYDKSTQYYKIARLDKLADNKSPGNLIKIHKKAGLTYGEGLMSLAPNLQTLRHIASGTIDHNINTDKIELKIALGLDFIIPDEALDLLIQDIDDAQNLQPVDITQKSIQKRFVELLGPVYSKKILERMSQGGYNVPKQLERSFLFNDIKMKWDTKSNSYRSVGQIGVNNIRDQLINKYVTGNIAIEHSSRGDVVNMFFKVGTAWYFFSFSHNQLRTLSSNSTYNEIFENMKTKDKTFKTKFGRYSFQLTSPTAKNRFVRQFMQFNEPEIDENELEDDED